MEREDLECEAECGHCGDSSWNPTDSGWRQDVQGNWMCFACGESWDGFVENGEGDDGEDWDEWERDFDD